VKADVSQQNQSEADLLPDINKVNLLSKCIRVDYLCIIHVLILGQERKRREGKLTILSSNQVSLILSKLGLPRFKAEKTN
jgi:hypothetical protein